MTAAGEAVLAVARSQIGVTEDPPGSNNVPYDDAWGFWSAWCATFVSWCCTTAGYPLPPIDGPAGFSYCPSGQIAAYETGHEVGEAGAEPGDTLIFSWEPWHMEGGIAICSTGVYAGAAAGDHTAFLVAHLGGGALQTIEGNTSSLSWDNGGEVRERWDRATYQICAYARHAALEGGPSQPPEMIQVTYTYQPERIDIVGVSGDGQVWHRWYDGTAWHPGPVEEPGGWALLTHGFPEEWGCKPGTAASCAWYGDQLQVFWARRDGQVASLFWAPSVGWTRMAIAGTVESVSTATKHRLVES